MENNHQNPELILLDKGPFQSLNHKIKRELQTRNHEGSRVPTLCKLYQCYLPHMRPPAKGHHPKNIVPETYSKNNGVFL